MMAHWDPIAWVALASLAVTVLGLLGTGAFYVGKHSNRLDTLETRSKDIETEARKAQDQVSKMQSDHAGMAEKLIALKNTVDDGFREVKQSIHDAFGQRQIGTRRAPRAED